MLDGNFECGVKEIFIPRNYFNVAEHNNGYSLTYDKDIETLIDFKEYKIDFQYSNAENTVEFWKKLNESILEIIGKSNAVKFVFNEVSASLTLDIGKGFEVIITEAEAPKLLFMLNLPNEDIKITESSNYQFRPSNQLKKQTFTIINKNPKNVKRNKIPIASLNVGKEPSDITELAAVINENISLLKLEKSLQVSAIAEENVLRLKMAPNVEITFNRSESDYFINAFNINEKLAYFAEEQFALMEGRSIPVIGFINIEIKEYYTITEKKRVTENYLLDVGIYNTAQKLFESIKRIHLSHLPNYKVRMVVPVGLEVKFSKGLGDMLGFVNTNYDTGTFVSKYPLELDGGITELYVYTDIISTYHVGDTFAKCLCVIPCMAERGDQIVRHYQNPLYFPVSQNFIESIFIQIKTGSGNNIIFNGGKVYVLLSFRRKRL